MKTKIIAGIGIAILAVALIFTMKPKSFSDEFAQTMKDMDSYILQGNMEITKGEDVKAYAKLAMRKVKKIILRFL